METSNFISIGVVFLAITFAVVADNKLKNSLAVTDNMLKNSLASVNNPMVGLNELNDRWDYNDLVKILWNNNNPETYLDMLSSDCANYVEVLAFPNRKFRLTDEGNNLLNDLDMNFKSWLLLQSQKELNQNPAKIILNNLSYLQKLRKSYNDKNDHMSLLTLAGVINAFLV